MGLFEAMGSSLHKAQVIATLGQLLDQLADRGVLDGHPRRLAEQLVAVAWTQKPALFEGKTGPRPHKLSIAAMSLAVGVRCEARQEHPSLQDAYTFALSLLLHEIAHEAARLPFHDVDRHLLDAAAATLDEPQDALLHGPLIDWHGL
ncbi:hypothetical protein [Dyella sp. C9]|uniref:hypothetical protein n=1 Tax=Dyella sp. C9 TaxID=2202154 RepID=UPI000DEF01D5|nr:hypothetical protein [Dyella sp. C9]